MKIKYKLIKPYPSEYKLGDVVEKTDNDFYDIKGKSSIHKSYVENWPDYWKKLSDLSYTIKAFRKKNVDAEFSKSFDHDFLDKWLKDGWEILSVERLFDHEVFSLDEDTEQGKIDKLVVDPSVEDGIKIIMKDGKEATLKLIKNKRDENNDETNS